MIRALRLLWAPTRRLETLGWILIALLAGGAWAVDVTVPPPTPQVVLGWKDVTKYGAKCDNVTDDTAAFTAAFAAAATIPGGTVYVPPTATPCLFSQLLANANWSYVTFRGGGASDDNIVAKGPGQLKHTGAAQAILFPTNVAISNFVMQDLDLLCNGNSTQGIDISPGSSGGNFLVRSTFERVSVHGCTATGANGVSHEAGVNNTFRQIYTYGNFTGFAISGNQSTALTAYGLRSRVNNLRGLSISGCASPAHLTFVDALIESNKDAGVVIDPVNNICYGISFFHSSLWTNNTLSGPTQFVTTTSGTGTVRNVLLDGVTFAGAGGAINDIDLAACIQCDVHNVVGGAVSGAAILKITGTSSRVRFWGINAASGGTIDNPASGLVEFGLGATNASQGFPSTMRIPSTTFSNLPTAENFSIVGCSDCTVANPCAGSGTGAVAKRLNGAWVCN
jgi:hypothetical protein